MKVSNSEMVISSDGESWPSLTESTRSVINTNNNSHTNNNNNTHSTTLLHSKAPASSQSPQNQRQPHNNRQRSSARGGLGRGGASRGGFIRHPPPPQQLPSPPPVPPAFYTGFEGGPVRGPFFHGNGFGPQPRPSDHQFPQPSSSHRGRRFNNRGPDWNAAPQGFHQRDVRFAPMGPPMVYPMPPQPLVPFPFMHPPMLPEPFMGMATYNGGHAPVPPLSLSPPSPVDLQTKLLNQINYYFSDENLVKDMYLRSQMDNGGWVPVTLIANFNKVRQLTQDIQLILETMGGSAIVEVQGDKIRRRNDWRKWITTGPVSEEPITEVNTIMRYLQNATLEEVHAADRSSSSATNASFSPREVLT